MENLTPPANGKNGPDGAQPAQAVPRWNVASWNRCARISASASTPAPERGADPRRPRYAPGRTRRSRSHRQRRQKARAAAHNAPPPWPFSLPCIPACPACRISSPARAGCCRQPPRGKAGKYPGSAGHSAWILRPPPAPAWISTASAAPDDHASSRPPPTMTTHQRQPCHTCTAPTACQPCQTSQQPAPTDTAPRQPCRPPAAADQHHPRPPNGPKPAHRGPLPEGSDSLPTRHIDYAV